MSKRLEDFIRANREEFDDLEPSPAIWARIERQLPVEGAAPKKREAKVFSLGFVLRVAAAVVLVMVISFVLFLSNIDTRKSVDLAAINPGYAEQQMHYASLVQSKRTELKEIAKTNPELYDEFSGEIAKIQAAYKKLNRDLATSPNQELVLRAMIENLQIQTQVLNQQLNVIEQYNQVKKAQKNETEDI